MNITYHHVKCSTVKNTGLTLFTPGLPAINPTVVRTRPCRLHPETQPGYLILNLYATRTKNELEETIATQVPEFHSSFRTGVSHSWSQHTFQKCQRASFHGTLFNGFPIRQKYYLNGRGCHIGKHRRTRCFCL